jgi:hypothetical protein
MSAGMLLGSEEATCVVDPRRRCRCRNEACESEEVDGAGISRRQRCSAGYLLAAIPTRLVYRYWREDVKEGERLAPFVRWPDRGQ